MGKSENEKILPLSTRKKKEGEGSGQRQKEKRDTQRGKRGKLWGEGKAKIERYSTAIV